MFWLLFMFAMYFFIFFKFQGQVYLLLPIEEPSWGRDDDYYAFASAEPTLCPI